MQTAESTPLSAFALRMGVEMTGFHKVKCFRCEGRGVIRCHLLIERVCPVCQGTGLVSDYGQPITTASQPGQETVHLDLETAPEMLPIDAQTLAVPLTRQQVRALKQRIGTQGLTEHDEFVASKEHLHTKHSAHQQEFVEGAQPDPHDYIGRMRQR